MSDEELYKHRQVDTRKLVANEPTLAPNLIDVLREDVTRDLQDQLRLARLYLSVPDPTPKDYETDRPLPCPAPLKLSHYCGANGGIWDGSKAAFG